MSERAWVRVGVEHFAGRDELYGDWYSCPACAAPHIHRDFAFCPDCGATVEWELGD